MPAGTYYLKELQAPTGYAPSQQLTEVIVDSTDVYADAGSVGDDVIVLRGIGKIVRSMLQFAVLDDINATLTDINAALYTAPPTPPAPATIGQTGPPRSSRRWSFPTTTTTRSWNTAPPYRVTRCSL